MLGLKKWIIEQYLTVLMLNMCGLELEFVKKTFRFCVLSLSSFCCFLFCLSCFHFFFFVFSYFTLWCFTLFFINKSYHILQALYEFFKVLFVKEYFMFLIRNLYIIICTNHLFFAFGNGQKQIIVPTSLYI